jgi:hypothetical protein
MRLQRFALLIFCGVAAAAQTNPMPATGAADVSIAPPATAKVLLVARGEGVQIYSCETKGDQWLWESKGPEATLFDAQGAPIGKHFTGPTWQLADGSTIVGTPVASQRQVTTIPWLLLSAKSSGQAGTLDAVRFVQRTDTVGGRPPAVGCDAQHPHTESRVPYSAKYSFYTDSK